MAEMLKVSDHSKERIERLQTKLEEEYPGHVTQKEIADAAIRELPLDKDAIKEWVEAGNP